MESYSLDSNNWVGILLRLGLALTMSGAIGWNRQRRHKPAGLRTHMLISIGAALFVLIPLHSSVHSGDAASRAIQGVATGVGFLGAGEILHLSRSNSSNPKVTGLTSAASTWVTAALGIASGWGWWQLAVSGTVMTLMTLGFIKMLEESSFVRLDNGDD